MGFFYRTIRIVENGIKPAYVFDGKPPEMKKGVVSTDASSSCPAINKISSSLSDMKNAQKPRRKERRLKRLELLKKWTNFRGARSK
jgi:5'-3' exonuclease